MMTIIRKGKKNEEIVNHKVVHILLGGKWVYI